MEAFPVKKRSEKVGTLVQSTNRGIFSRFESVCSGSWSIKAQRDGFPSTAREVSVSRFSQVVDRVTTKHLNCGRICVSERELKRAGTVHGYKGPTICRCNPVFEYCTGRAIYAFD